MIITNIHNYVYVYIYIYIYICYASIIVYHKIAAPAWARPCPHARRGRPVGPAAEAARGLST